MCTVHDFWEFRSTVESTIGTTILPFTSRGISPLASPPSIIFPPAYYPYDKLESFSIIASTMKSVSPKQLFIYHPLSPKTIHVLLQMKTLQVLKLEDLTDCKFTDFTTLPYLTRLHISVNCLNVDTSLAISLQKLTHLSITFRKICMDDSLAQGDTILLSSVTRDVEIFDADNYFDSTWNTMQRLIVGVPIKRLSLRFNVPSKFNRKWIQSLSSCKTLESLNLTNIGPFQEDVTNITGVTSMRHCSVRNANEGSHVSDWLILHCTHLLSLRMVEGLYIPLTDSQMATFTNLEALEMEVTPWSYRCIASILASCPPSVHTMMLSLSSHVARPDLGMQALSNIRIPLRALALRSVSWGDDVITTDSILSLSISRDTLRSLCFTNMSLRSNVLGLLSNVAPRLTLLDIESCSIKDEDLIGLCTMLFLQKLNIKDNRKVTAQGIVDLLDRPGSCPSLIVLICDKMDDTPSDRMMRSICRTKGIQLHSSHFTEIDMDIWREPFESAFSTHAVNGLSSSSS